MGAKAKRTRKLLVILSCVFYVYIYLLFHVPNYVFEPDNWQGTSRDVYLVIREISEMLVNYLVPVAVSAFIFATEEGIASAARKSVALSLPILIYSLPYCYLYAISEFYDTPESIAISIGISAVGLLIQSLHVFLLYLLARLVSARRAKSDILTAMTNSKGARAQADKKELWQSALSKSRAGITEDKVLSLSTYGGLGVFAICFADFVLRFIVEIVQTINFFISVGASISAIELITVILTYVFLLCELIIVFAASAWLKNRASREISAVPEAKEA